MSPDWKLFSFYVFEYGVLSIVLSEWLDTFCCLHEQVQGIFYATASTSDLKVFFFIECVSFLLVTKSGSDRWNVCFVLSLSVERDLQQHIVCWRSSRTVIAGIIKSADNNQDNTNGYSLFIYLFFCKHWKEIILCFHSRGQHLCKFIGTKESVYVRKESNSHRTGLGHKHGPRFIVLGHNMATLTSCENTQ